LRISIIFLLGIFLFTCSRDQSANPTSRHGKLFIIGGGVRPQPMVETMLSEAGISAADYIAILPWASSEPDSSTFYAKKQFQELGQYFFLDIQPTDMGIKEKKDSLLNAKLIYIPGGDQSIFMKLATSEGYDSLLHQAYNNGALIAGTSAGAAIMSKLMITGTALKETEYFPTFRSLESENLETEMGLSLLPGHIIIDQHFVTRSRYNRLLTAIIEDPSLVGWGIEEATAALVIDNEVTVIGAYQIIVFNNESKKSKSQNGLLGAEKISLSIYLPGEKFKLD
jgi:cyanophycinase